MSESKLQQYIDTIEQLESEEVYDYVLELGQQNHVFTDRLEQNFVHGCQSPVWVTGTDDCLLYTSPSPRD